MFANLYCLLMILYGVRREQWVIQRVVLEHPCPWCMGGVPVRVRRSGIYQIPAYLPVATRFYVRAERRIPADRTQALYWWGPSAVWEIGRCVRSSSVPRRLLSIKVGMLPAVGSPGSQPTFVFRSSFFVFYSLFFISGLL